MAAPDGRVLAPRPASTATILDDSVLGICQDAARVGRVHAAVRVAQQPRHSHANQDRVVRVGMRQGITPQVRKRPGYPGRAAPEDGSSALHFPEHRRAGRLDSRGRAMYYFAETDEGPDSACGIRSSSCRDAIPPPTSSRKSFRTRSMPQTCSSRMMNLRLRAA